MATHPTLFGLPWKLTSSVLRTIDLSPPIYPVRSGHEIFQNLNAQLVSPAKTPSPELNFIFGDEWASEVNMQCVTWRCDENDGRKKERTIATRWPLSLRVHSTNILMEERCILGNVQRWRLTESVRCHMGDTKRIRKWSRFTDSGSFPCCGRTASLFLSGVVVEVCRLATTRALT